MLATRPAILETLVTETDGFESWTADYSPRSLAALDDWLLLRLHPSPDSGPAPVTLKPADLTALLHQTKLSDRTLSLLLDCGFYLGQVIQRSMPGTRWFQVRTGGRRFIDFGHVVLGPFALYNFNPVRLMMSKGYAHFDNPQKEMTLAQIHDHWRQKAVLAG